MKLYYAIITPYLGNWSVSLTHFLLPHNANASQNLSRNSTRNGQVQGGLLGSHYIILTRHFDRQVGPDIFPFSFSKCSAGHGRFPGDLDFSAVVLPSVATDLPRQQLSASLDETLACVRFYLSHLPFCTGFETRCSGT